jgi:hypothetical protein
MIIGAIVNGGGSTTGPSSLDHDGYSLMHFYTAQDAEDWAVLQSSNTSMNSNNLYLLCTVINTDDNTKRWWYAGTEYTG